LGKTHLAAGRANERNGPVHCQSPVAPGKDQAEQKAATEAAHALAGAQVRHPVGIRPRFKIA
jgi:hypothetical protein